MKATEKFRHYLVGKPFKLRTDHQAIQFLHKSKPTTGKLLFRWLEKLQEFEYTVEHVSGHSIPHVDALSRQHAADTQKTEDRQGLRVSAPVFVPRSVRGHSGVSTSGEDPAGQRQTLRENRNTASGHLIYRVTEDEDVVEHDEGRWNCSADEIRLEVSKDPVLSRLCQDVKKKQDNSKMKLDGLTSAQQVELRFYSRMDGLFIKDGIIYRRSEVSQDSQIILPGSLRAKALKLGHEVPMAGHGGIRRTLHRLTASVFWYNIRADVKKFVAGCSSCLANKPKNQKCREGRGAVPVEGEPLKHWAADILELPCSRDGYRYVLVVTDMFSKLVEIFPLKRHTALDIADCFLQIICRYGVMCSLLTDQGRNFESKLIKEVCNKLGVEKLRTSVYRPCCNGVTERFNRTLCEMLSHFAEEPDWPALLPLLAAAYNTSTHSTTGFTPFELIHGGTARTVLKAEFDTPADLPQKTHSEYLQQLKQKLAKMREVAAEKIRKEQASRTDQPEPVFKTGELVWCRNFTAKKGVKGKFDAKFEGPYRVMQSRPPDYVIKKGKKRRLIHGAHLKRGDVWRHREVEVS